MKATKFQNVENAVAAIGPIGVAFHTHHTVKAFHNTKVSEAHPAMRHQSRLESEYDALMCNNGINATNRGNPLTPHHPSDRSRTESMTYNIFCFIILIFSHLA
jgi:hypothetical protein